MAKHHWYKRSPSDFVTGCIAADMDVEEIGAYSLILDLIYDKGPIDFDPQWLGRMFKCSTRRARKLVERLIEKDKITLLEGNHLDNLRAQKERSSEQKPPKNRRKTGEFPAKNGSENRPVSGQNNNLAEKNSGLRARVLEARSYKTTDRDSPINQESSGAASEDGGLVAARTMCAEFRNLESRHFARPPRQWHHSDLAVAKEWVAEGITLGTVRQVIDEMLAKSVAANRQPPRTLSYFTQAVRRAQAEVGFENNAGLTPQGWWAWPDFPFSDYYWNAVCELMKRQPDFSVHQPIYDEIIKAAVATPKSMRSVEPVDIARTWMAKHGRGLSLPGRLYEATPTHQDLCRRAAAQHEGERKHA